MSKYDIYLYDDCNVLKNRLGIKDEKELDVAESEYANANMMMLYDSDFSDFSPTGICKIHKAIFEDVYEWAGEYREINIQKREHILAGKSVWYSNWDAIENDLKNAWNSISKVKWNTLTQNEFATKVAHLFPKVWQTHPFREGNTRTVVMMIALFAEHYGYFFDYELIAASAGYVRNSFVLASLGEYSEFEHLEKILKDAISTEPIENDDLDEVEMSEKTEKYKKYYSKDYKPSPHEYISNE